MCLNVAQLDLIHLVSRFGFMKFVRLVVVFQSFFDGFLGSSSKVSNYLIVASIIVVVVSSFFHILTAMKVVSY